MPENLPESSSPPTTDNPKARAGNGKNKVFLSLMLAATVVAAGGYAMISKGSDGAPVQSAPFNPPIAEEKIEGQKTPDSPDVTITKEKPKVVVKTDTKTEKNAPEPSETYSESPSAPSSSSLAPSSLAPPVKIAKLDTGKSAKSGVPTKIEVATKQSKPAAKKAGAPRVAQVPQSPTSSRATGDWAEYRGPNRDGISQETGWFKKDSEPQMVWKDNIGAGFASIVVANGRAYAMGNSNNTDTIYCYDAANGKGIWKQSYACDLMDKQHEGGPSATPTISDGMVYTYSKMGQLNAWDATTGKLGWSKNIAREMGGQVPGWGISSTPAVYGNSLFVMTGAPGKCITAFDKKSGKVLWQAGDASPSYAALQVFQWKGAPYLCVFDAQGVKYMDTKNGKTLWSYGWKTNYDVNAAIPIINGDKVFISSGYGTGCAMLQTTADDPLLWKNRDMKNHFNASVWLNDAIFGFDESELTCLDAKTGRKLWSQGRLGKGSLIAADNKLIILSERGELVIAEANPQGFKELSRTQILGGKCWSAPSLANGRIYARNANGDLVCAKF